VGHFVRNSAKNNHLILNIDSCALCNSAHSPFFLLFVTVSNILCARFRVTVYPHSATRKLTLNGLTMSGRMIGG